MRAKRIAMAAAALLWGAAGALTAAAVELPGPLVDARWLEQHRHQVVLLDARKDLKSYAETGHIPGAILVDWSKVRADLEQGGVVYEKMLLDPPRFETLMQAHGVNRDSSVVIATKGENAAHLTFGARLYWQLKYYGHDRVALLDGGTAQWAAETRKLVHDPSPARSGDFKVADKRDEILATTEDVVRVLGSGTAQLVDSRPLAFYLGLEKRKYVDAAGHIPGAKTMPYTLLTPMKGPGVLRAASDIRQAATALGVDPGKPVIAYCNSGQVAASVWFVLHELLGNKAARLYDGSMHAWTKDARRPVTTMRVD